MLNPEEVLLAIEQKDPVKLASVIKKYNLVIKDNKLTADSQNLSESAVYWDRMQLIKKILLNS
jgi:hypothetical protein